MPENLISKKIVGTKQKKMCDFVDSCILVLRKPPLDEAEQLCDVTHVLDWTR